MLYDLIPPAIFFVSLASIIVVVGRIVGRLKRQALSAAIQTEGGKASSSPTLFHSRAGKITLVKSRLSALAGSVAESLRSLKPALARLRPARRVSSPNPVSAAVKPSRPAPAVKLRRVETAPQEPEPSRVETTAQRLQALVRTKRATTSPVQTAQAALLSGNVTGAEDILIPYIAKHPHNTTAYVLLADVALARAAWDEAVEILEQVIQLDAATPSAYAKLGEAALKGGHMTRALEALQRAHDAEPTNVNILKNLFTIAQRRDDRVLQKTVLQKMIVLAPDDPEVHLAAEVVEAREEEREHTPAAQ